MQLIEKRTKDLVSDGDVKFLSKEELKSRFGRLNRHTDTMLVMNDQIKKARENKKEE